MTQSGAALLSATQVRKHFGDHHVLKGADLDVAAHEVVCLIGAIAMRR